MTFMKHRRRVVLALFMAIAAAGCFYTLRAESPYDTLAIGPSPFKFIIDKVEKDQVMDTATGKMVTISDMVAKAKYIDVFIIGEAHDNYQCHTFQRDFIEALVKQYPNTVVGFEFFYRDDNAFLEQWRNGQISEEELVKKTEWYKRGGLNYGYTRLIMDIIKKYKIKTIGLNVPRTILRTVSRKGFENLTVQEKALFPTIQIPNPEHEYFIKNIFGTFAAQVPMWFTNVYTAQKCWDVIMAESMRQTLTQKEFKGFKGVIIAGSNHVSYKLGIPFRYIKADPKAKLVTIVPVLLPNEKKKDDTGNIEEENPMVKMLAKSLKPAAVFSRGIADYVFAADQPADSFFPTIGFTVDEKENKLVITAVSKESIAQKNGLKEGDQLISVDGVPVSTLEQMRLILSTKNWNDAVQLGIIKKVEIKKDEKK